MTMPTSEPKASMTALFSAFGRAYHATYDRPKIFDDSLAAGLLGAEQFETFKQNLARGIPFFAPEAQGLSVAPAEALAIVMRAMGTSITLCRARYTEDLLEDSFRRGVRQYVILGAGLDTFAFRRREMLPELRVFEVDHPATQADKLARIRRAGWAIPEGLCFVPVDLSHEEALSRLPEAGLDPRRPAFFSWLGVTYYLARETVSRTLGAIARLGAPGSVVVFDHIDLDALSPDRAAPRMRRMVAASQTAGEPMQTGLEPASLPRELREVGLIVREQLGPAEIQARYFEAADNGYRAFEQLHLVTAEVARDGAATSAGKGATWGETEWP